MGKRYTDAERQAAMDLAASRGYRYAADESGVPIGTLKSWMRRNGRQVNPERRDALEAQVRTASLHWEARRADLANQAGEVAALALARTRDLIEGQTIDGKDVMTRGPGGRLVVVTMHEARAAAATFATLADKAQLLSGGATARTETMETAMERAMEALDALEQGSRGPATTG